MSIVAPRIVKAITATYSAMDDDDDKASPDSSEEEEEEEEDYLTIPEMEDEQLEGEVFGGMGVGGEGTKQPAGLNVYLPT